MFRLRTTLFLCVALLAVVAAPALAKPKAVSGSLSAKGYTVIALSYSGKATSVDVRGGKFTLVPPAAKFTLHLRAKNGKYGGPIVVGGSGRSAVLGVKAGARLGKLKLGRGFARVTKTLPARIVDAKRTAAAMRGVPIGAGRYGLVRAAAKGTNGPGADADHDGIPGAFDVDDNGNLVIDNQDGVGPKARKADGLQAPPSGDTFQLFSNFHFDVSETLNANAGGVTKQQIDAALTKPRAGVGLVFPVPTADLVELDCGSLSYCSAGGTGYVAEPYPDGKPFPSCCDSNGNGLGEITAGPTGDFQLRTRAASDKIGSGDTFIERVTTGGAEHDLTGVLNYIFNTTPAVKSYVDGSGAGQTISYPVPAGGPGTRENPIVLHPGADGDLSLTFTFWRPQRSAIPGTGEGDGFVDIGGLDYAALVPNGPNGPGATMTRGPQTCGSTAVSTNDPNLASSGFGQLHDSAGDRIADPANTLTLTVDFTKCLAQAGQALQPGQSVGFEIQALSQMHDVAAQGFTACLPEAGRTDCAAPGPPPGP
jgi:hypothetical protein